MVENMKVFFTNPPFSLFLSFFPFCTCVFLTQKGVNLCAGVVCEAKDQCHQPGTCKSGVCDSPVRPDNYPCDDGINATLDDVCRNGLCAGIDPCSGVTCAAPEPCQRPGVCRRGVCVFDQLPDDSVCNDTLPETYVDRCTAGLCAGLVPCTGLCVAFVNQVNVRETLLRGLARVGAVEGWTAGAISLQSFAASSDLAGFEAELVMDGATFMIGLGNADTSVSFNDIEFGIFVSSRGSLMIYESGVFRAIGGTYKARDTIGVWVGADGRVVYVHNQRAMYTSRVTPRYPLFVDTSLFDVQAQTGKVDFVTKQDVYCRNVSCAAVSQCHETPTCVVGQCTAPVAKANGTACNDNDPLTDLDECRSGVCQGQLLCITQNVTCPQPDQCQLPTTCRNGRCPSLPRKPVGTACDDGNPVTDLDACTATGTCQGVDLCIPVVCSPASQCHFPGTCSRGNCSASLPKPA